MTHWKSAIKRSNTSQIRKEDMLLSFLQKGTYTGVLTPETKSILSRIYDFLCFPQFAPSDILYNSVFPNNKGDVKVFLDDKKERTYVVTPEELEDELIKTKEEIQHLRDLLEMLGQSKREDKRLSELYDKFDSLKKKAAEIERRLCGKDYVIKTELLGYYCRSILADGSSQPEIHLMMGTLGNDYILTAITFVHELMHAYFDHHDSVIGHPECRSIEEPLAEYGMLCFMERFSLVFSCYTGLMYRAETLVMNERFDLGVCDYGYGYFLFKDKGSFCADWISLFHEYAPLLCMNGAEVRAYDSMISPIRYPKNERACEFTLLEVLKPVRFHFKADARPSDRIIIRVAKEVYDDTDFVNDYLIASSVIKITFEDSKGYRFSGEAKVYKGESAAHPERMCFWIEGDKSLLGWYNTTYGPVTKSFSFAEIRPGVGACHPEWIAREI